MEQSGAVAAREPAERSAPPGVADPRERWEWRRRIRRAPARYRVYRLAVGLVGVVLVLVGLVLGPFPGPGGIPLILGGLAILASEFIWARRLLERARAHLMAWTRWAARQPLWLRSLGVAVLLAGVAGALYLGLVVGAPGWVPEPVRTPLLALPGVQPWGVR